MNNLIKFDDKYSTANLGNGFMGFDAIFRLKD
jgi:hypothetical protein